MDLTRTAIRPGSLLDTAQALFSDLFPSRAKLRAAVRSGRILRMGTAVVDTNTPAELVSVAAGDVIAVPAFSAIDFVRERDAREVQVLYQDEHVAVVWKESGQTTTSRGPGTFLAALPWGLEVARPTAQLRCLIQGSAGQGYEQQEELEDDPVFAVSMPFLRCVNSMGSSLAGCVLVAKTRQAYDVLEKDDGICFMHRGLLIGSLSAVRQAGDHTLQTPAGVTLRATGDGILQVTSRLSSELPPCTTELRLVKETRTNHDPDIDASLLAPTTDRLLSTVDAFIVQGHPGRQIRQHCLDIGLPVIGNTNLTRPLKSSKVNGMLLCLRSVSFQHPVDPACGRVHVEHDEPAKFETLRTREEGFWRKREQSERELLLLQGQEADVEQGTAPLAYRIGHATFCGLRFAVSPDVLIPRASTELLVTTALQYLSKGDGCDKHVLDLGVGSGNVLLSILHAAPDPATRGVGVDISPGALAVAAKNAESLGLASRVALFQGSFADLTPALDCLPAGDGGIRPTWPYAVVTCNPPYHARTEDTAPLSKRSRLDRAVVQHEPGVALFADSSDGMSAYRDICRSVAHLGLAPWLLLECGNRMEDRVAEIVSAVQLTQDSCRLQVVDIVHGKRGSPKVVVVQLLPPGTT
ncbi:hypothetical protein RI367_001328 [Sorochytrium milnesiophthora]